MGGKKEYICNSCGVKSDDVLICKKCGYNMCRKCFAIYKDQAPKKGIIFKSIKEMICPRCRTNWV